MSRSNLSASPLEPAAQDVIDITGGDELGRELNPNLSEGHRGASRGPLRFCTFVVYSLLEVQMQVTDATQ